LIAISSNCFNGGGKADLFKSCMNSSFEDFFNSKRNYAAEILARYANLIN
jgi:hypothetical protein